MSQLNQSLSEVFKLVRSENLDIGCLESHYRMGSHFSFLESRYDIKNEFPNFDETFIFLSKYFFPTWIFVYFIQGVTAWVLKIHTPVLYYLE